MVAVTFAFVFCKVKSKGEGKRGSPKVDFEKKKKKQGKKTTLALLSNSNRCTHPYGGGG
jgi:hypothetical protein